VNTRAGSNDVQQDKNFNVKRLNAPSGSTIVPGIRANPSIGRTAANSSAPEVATGSVGEQIHIIGESRHFFFN